MSFLAPLAGILAALTLPVVVILYFLKLKRREVTVPSTLLWQRSFMDLRANTPFQKLRRNLLMFLQLLILAALALALAHPLIKAPSLTGRTLVICMDVSASMGVREAGGSRLELAQAKAGELLEDLGRNDEAMIVAFHRSAETVSEFTSTTSLLRDSINRLRPRETGTSVGDALLLALGMVRGRPNPEVVIVTDGALGDLPAIPEGDAVPIRAVVVGKTTANLGLTALEVRAPPEPGKGPEVFVRLQNFGDSEAKTGISCRLEGTVIAEQEVTVGARSEEPFVVKLDPDAQGLCEVRIDADDAFASDNAVRTAIAPERKFRVTLVAEGSWFLERMLPAMPRIEAVKVSPADFAREGPMAGVAQAPDVMIVTPDAIEQTASLKPGAYLIFGGCKLDGVVTGDADVNDPIILDWNRVHPVTRFVSFSHLNIASARRWDLPEDADVILEAEEGPLIAVLVRGGVRVLMVAFDPLNTDWPFRPSYPLFIANAIEWLAGGASPTRGYHLRCGDPLELHPAPGATVVKLKDPAGELHSVKVDESGVTLFADTYRMGLYDILEGEADKRAVAANLIDPAESRIAPVEKLGFPEGGPAIAVSRESLVAERELWRWIVLAAFFVLMLEWYVYHRRAI